jgi:endonuclease/exonuclease/phosphatase family metal-dependent hydrolase
MGSESKTISVMSRNIYLGADVGVALDLLPDFPAAAQFMWDQMRATDFEKRSRVLAKELFFYRPDVVGIQDATKWICKKGILSKKKTIFDFLQMLIEDTRRTGVGYSLAIKGNTSTLNTGFSLPAIPRLTMVKDPNLFTPIFGQESASCGFEIADAILIRDEFMGDVIQAGTSEYTAHYTVVPALLEIYRGYSWVDLNVDGHTVRIVTTHLESLFDQDSEPHSSVQASQLIQDLKSTKSPLVVMGDFNSDPRDPRGKETPNPGGQPIENGSCRSQPANPSPTNNDANCSAYWKMIEASFEDAGPNSLDPKNFTWGTSALLDGPDVDRARIAKEWGNPNGFTEKLDYIFVSNGIRVNDAQLLSNTWQESALLWDCDFSVEREAECLPSDHVGVFARITLPPNEENVVNDPLPSNQSIPWVSIGVTGVALLTLSLLLWLLYRSLLRPLVMLPLRTRVLGRDTGNDS